MGDDLQQGDAINSPHKIMFFQKEMHMVLKSMHAECNSQFYEDNLLKYLYLVAIKAVMSSHN